MDPQHPIPQEISSYQFRLVGDMTLKQFFQLAGGLLISLLFYASNLPGIIKWPLILLFGILGAALAFVPFEDRPLSMWIIAFFKSVYSPTIFSWKKTDAKNVYFQPEAEAEKGKAVVDAKLQQDVQKHSFMANLEAAEQKFLSRISSLIGGKAQKQKMQVQKQVVQPTPQPSTPQPTTQRVVEPLPVKKGSKGKIQIPKLDYVQVQKEKRPKLSVEEQGYIYEKPKTSAVSPVVQAQQRAAAAQEATFSAEAAPPSPPSTPNTVVGQVFGPKGKIIESAILEIRDIGGRPVRAVKTNKLGHFLIVTPLQNGRYEIVTEKEGYEFDNVSFEAQGEIIPPIAIKAREKVIVQETQSN